jgi:hypothetical protein
MIVIENECADCGAELNIDVALVGKGKVKIITQPCQHCVARKAIVATTSEWGRKKIEREARI